MAKAEAAPPIVCPENPPLKQVSRGHGVAKGEHGEIVGNARTFPDELTRRVKA
jgi:hypothetical protein